MKKTLVLLFAIAVCAALSWGQTPFTKVISVGDGITTYQLTLGVDATGSYGVDATLGERELPPIPVTGLFDARFIAPRVATDGFGVGRDIDIRALVTDCTLDTFKLAFQPSTEAGSTIIISWPALTGVGCGYWFLQSDFSSQPLVKVNMLEQSSVTIDVEEWYPQIISSLYIIKGDGAEYRTFTNATFATDGITDAKGKKTYGKAVKATSNQVEFTAEFVNNSGAAASYLHVEFKTALDTSTIDITGMPNWAPTKAGKFDKIDFSGASIPVGGTVVVSAFGVKSGTKVQSATYYWYYLDAGKVKVQGAKVKTTTFPVNIVRLPMPNTINLGEQLFASAYPKGTPMVVGTTARTDTAKYIAMAKYGDVLKTLAKDAGKVGKEKYQDANASYLNSYDDTKKGLRMGAAIKKAVTNLPPDKHKNRLVGEATALSLNLALSTASRTPAGLGALAVNNATSLFNGMTVSQVLAATNYYLSYGSYPALPTATADNFADICAAINGAFSGDMDTASWSGGTVVANGAKQLGSLYGWLVRPGMLAGQMTPEVTSGNQPFTYSLQQNYPNPFNPTTNIAFTLAQNSSVTVKVFNLLGQEVATLLNNQEFAAGQQTISFNASNLTSGVYFYRISVNTNGQEIFQDIKKMVLLK